MSTSGSIQIFFDKTWNQSQSIEQKVVQYVENQLKSFASLGNLTVQLTADLKLSNGNFVAIKGYVFDNQEKLVVFTDNNDHKQVHTVEFSTKTNITSRYTFHSYTTSSVTKSIRAQRGKAFKKTSHHRHLHFN